MSNHIDMRPLAKLERNHIRQRRQFDPNNEIFQSHSAFFNETLINNIWHQIQPVLNDHISSHLHEPSKSKCKRTTDNGFVINAGDYVEYCVEKILNQNGKSYSTKTSAILYRNDGTRIPLHLAESSVEFEIFDHLN